MLSTDRCLANFETAHFFPQSLTRKRMILLTLIALVTFVVNHDIQLDNNVRHLVKYVGKCGKFGHFNRVCKWRAVSTIHKTCDSEEDFHVDLITKLHTSPSCKKTSAVINDFAKLEMLIDTSSDVTTISRKMAENLNIAKSVLFNRKLPHCLSVSVFQINIGWIPNATTDLKGRNLINTI